MDKACNQQDELGKAVPEEVKQQEAAAFIITTTGAVKEAYVWLGVDDLNIGIVRDVVARFLS